MAKRSYISKRMRIARFIDRQREKVGIGLFCLYHGTLSLLVCAVLVSCIFLLPLLFR